MALPTAYMTSRKRLPDIFDAIRTAQAPEKFTQKFLENLEFKAKGDRLIINILKKLGFIDDTGKPIQRYYEYLDQTQSSRVLAEGIKEAYSDLYAINVNAHHLPKQELIGKFKTLSQGQYGDGVLNHMVDTFLALVKLADFKAHKKKTQKTSLSTSISTNENQSLETHVTKNSEGINLGGLVYNIQIILPETRDPAVYDALFSSLKRHLK